ncbi:MAG: GNAT family N-acetyltransferase [Acidimicrobiia bacterium]|nr:GNAT family N-acetyltransferase [Acidimicrobiia bacterium]
MTSITDIERSGNRTWPALDELAYDGWLLRAACGFTRRANSITVYEASSVPLADKLTASEEWYDRRRLPTIFRTTPLTDHDVLEELDRRGYDDIDGAMVMSTPITDAVRDGSSVSGVPGEDWWTVFSQDRDVEPHRSILEQMWKGQSLPIGFAVGRDFGAARAIGTAVIDGPYVAIFNMRTLPAAQRHGHAWEVLDRLLGWAQSHQVTHAYLQVAPANTAAVNLYMRYGFTWLYDYRYRTRPVAPAR